MNDELEKHLQHLADIDSKLIELANEMLQGLQYPMDVLACTVMNRTLALINGYVTLIRGNNFIAAAHLVRPNLDNYLRFYAGWLVSDANKFATEVIGGGQIRKMKDRIGNKMTDSYLVSCVKGENPWIEDVYENTSGFIHLSRQHVLSSIRVIDREAGIIEGTISREDRFISDELKVEATIAMVSISNLIGSLISRWVKAKQRTGKAADVE